MNPAPATGGITFEPEVLQPKVQQPLEIYIARQEVRQHVAAQIEKDLDEKIAPKVEAPVLPR